MKPIDIYQAQFKKKKYNNRPDAFPDTYALQRLPESGTLIDVGTGRAMLIQRLLRERPKWAVMTCDLAKFHTLDLTHMCIDLTNAADLVKLGTVRMQYLTCLGVLEHLPEAQIVSVIEVLSRIPTEMAIITTANHSDIGVLGVDLHVTQQPIAWWSERLAQYFDVEHEMEYANHRGFCFTLRPKGVEA